MALGLAVDESGFQLTVDGVDMICPAWALTRLVAFLRPRPQTIVNRRLNGGGVRCYPPIPGPVRIQAPFVLVGDCDRGGVPYANRTAGLASNLNYLIANVFGPSDPVRTATLWLPDEPSIEWSGPIQFEDVPTDGGYGGDTIEETITVVLPEGLSEVSGS